MLSSCAIEGQSPKLEAFCCSSTGPCRCSRHGRAISDKREHVHCEPLSPATRTGCVKPEEFEAASVAPRWKHAKHSKPFLSLSVEAHLDKPSFEARHLSFLCRARFPQACSRQAGSSMAAKAAVVSRMPLSTGRRSMLEAPTKPWTETRASTARTSSGVAIGPP